RPAAARGVESWCGGRRTGEVSPAALERDESVPGPTPERGREATQIADDPLEARDPRPPTSFPSVRDGGFRCAVMRTVAADPRLGHHPLRSSMRAAERGFRRPPSTAAGRFVTPEPWPTCSEN